ncbi:MAG: glycosyl transferase family 36 [candidate division KSB1 bacterium]|nr:glycosyl transferase family 36 [candidate division KSB1 bacterium]MDZ7336542.1 glycosyl transferase family 36 [candidate division KSB1 bacterium]MDZ7358752.1 glycosyl transferase family 36 [candidate division KSB1 bacterium]MDZ7377385.1 glycosyl transferase family 36 [candidate division KSB1 bacterium]MDZ7402261.1 glycosyl transferase family 36 [candidate division KSB1 bacterium]
MNKYGYFSEDRLEFVITRPDTPAPWVNYLSNGKYHGLISNTAGGFSFYISPRDSRITRWRYNSLPVDRPGRYILLRDRETTAFWSPTWQPTFTPVKDYECRHGMYYTRITSQFNQIRSSILYFVPSDDLELWLVTLKNESDHARQLDIFSFVELCLGHALVDLINQPNDQHFNEVFFDRGDQILFATKRYWVRFTSATVKQANDAWDKYVFFSSSLPIIGWDGSKDQFIGRWRSEQNPIAVQNGRCFNSEITAGDAVAALQMELTLQPNEEREFVVHLGVVPKQEGYQEKAVQLVQKYRNLDVVKNEFSKLKAEWSDYRGSVQVQTPDENMNTMINVWNQYQTSVTFRFSRDASYYHGGLLFGRGYRDSCQDVMGPVIPRPNWVKERIVEMARYQFSNGSTYHLYYPLIGGGERTGHSDTPLWLPLAIMVYLKETGDFDFLQQNIPFSDIGEATIQQHLYAAIDYVLGTLSPRHLAKIGPGDWNDTLDYLGREGRGESVWVSMFLAYILKETIELCQLIGDQAKSDRYHSAYQTVKQAINDHCWDGEWYIRATNDQGEIIGSASNEEGQIFLNTQSWAVISGVAEGQRAIQCMDMVIRHLETPKGPKILHPAYTKINPRIGLATRCVPGKKENGAVFNHPVSWAILAECLLGRGDRAFEIYQKALPMNPIIDIDRYQVEPYVYAEYVTSPDHPTFGQASHSWLTGSSAWMLRDGIDYILGVRPTYRGLLIDPCIPHQWKFYRVIRKFRGKTYHIEVHNPHGLNKGINQVEVAETKISGNLIDLTDATVQALIKGRRDVAIRATLGY